MAKIGTAHIEIKPVLNEEAMAAIGRRVEEAVARGVERGLRIANRRAEKGVNMEGSSEIRFGGPTGLTPAEVDKVIASSK